jgi:hypothetical protein
MKKLNSWIVACLSIALAACSTVSSQEPVDLLKNKVNNSPNQPPLIKPLCPAPTKKKNPLNVSLYNPGIKPVQNYKVLGQESISKFNQSGIKRQKANIHDLMRTIAAAMGGDAVINLKYDKKIVSGTVIKYENQEMA